MRPRNYKLDKEEREMLKAFERGEMKSVPNVEAEKARITQIVKNHVAKQHIVSMHYETKHSVQNPQFQARP